MIILDEIEFEGCEKIKATHRTTIEVTKENYITERGDCIIGINSNKSVVDLNKTTKEFLKSGNEIIIEIRVENISDKIIAIGSPNLLLTNQKSIVIRKSDFIDDRTMAIKSNKAAIDVDRKIVEILKNKARGKLILWKR
ncbi:MAG: DUF371 domain-containing protein [Candidatus Aenigmarchaeota archaeon]|nr:DUF371 domain-containing protein [Candidatus Aenigmarchaeota archaeon]MDW8149376.1 DUF371 domain-containing protein [Candidatus Aenigmarchaeota archaeon]